MARLFVIAAALLGAAMADDANYAAPAAASYSAPAASYSAPAASYAAPAASYGAPAASYGAPEASYSAPADSYSAGGYEQGYSDVGSYEEPATGYGPPADDGGFNLDKLWELIPFFLAVLAAIIIAQIIAPLIALAFGAKVGLIGLGLAPLIPAKIDLINSVLAPFSLAVCNIGPPLAIAGSTTGRSFVEEYGLNPEIVNFVAETARTVYESYFQ